MTEKVIQVSLHKEAIRFLGHASSEKNQKKGKVFVYVWIILTALLYLINFLSKNYFSYSASGEATKGLMDATYITLEVGTVFVLARILKLLMIRFFYPAPKNERK